MKKETTTQITEREYNPINKTDMEKKIRIFAASTIQEIEDWINSVGMIDYDSIIIQCHSCDISASGIIFTIIFKTKLP